MFVAIVVGGRMRKDEEKVVGIVHDGEGISTAGYT